jgi:EAL domain-containing protein (putative c-di-GMP-specific phosphodiesterase class I)
MSSLQDPLADDARATLVAFAQVICALAPEVAGVSFHDVAAETLWLSEDFLLPEDHQLVGHALASSSEGSTVFHYGRNEESGYSMAVAVRAASGEVNGAVRLTIDAQVEDPRMAESLEQRLAPVWVCLAAEFARRTVVPNLPSVDAVRLAQMETALDAKRFELFLQPIRSLRSESDMAHYEVLLRLRTAEGELLEPEAFFRTAGHRNLMPTIDRWVVRTLLVWLVNNRKLWRRAPAVFCVNLAAQSMTDANFVGYVESCVQKSGIPPQALCFEVTERFASSGNISVAESMRRLEALGCEVALDDFGGTATSYGYLRSVPADYFKIDGSLVVAAPTDKVAWAVISSIVKVASDLGVRTVAESVESATELAAVRELGVDYAQGYLFGRPRSLVGYDFSDVDA